MHHFVHTLDSLFRRMGNSNAFYGHIVTLSPWLIILLCGICAGGSGCGTTNRVLVISNLSSIDAVVAPWKCWHILHFITEFRIPIGHSVIDLHENIVCDVHAALRSSGTADFFCLRHQGTEHLRYCSFEMLTVSLALCDWARFRKCAKKKVGMGLRPSTCTSLFNCGSVEPES